jgi:predicted nucleotidyltransferase
MNGILGIVSEYNPFHNGHKLHIQESKALTGCTLVVSVMSGNFTQRGDTAIVDKWTRTEMALKQGVDLVIELPTLYATSSSENFADGAIKLLDSLGVVDYISFGSEIGEITPMNDVATVLANEPKEFKEVIQRELKSGLSYPKARELALQLYFGNSKKYTEVLENPNNILGIEYLKALKRQKSAINAITLKRKYSDYNSQDVYSGVASSTAIRTMLQTGKNIHYVVPYETYELLEEKQEKGQIITSLKAFEKEILYNLRKMSINDIANLPDVSEGLENKIAASVDKYNTLEEVMENVKSKRYTMTRIQRIMLHSLLDITAKDINMSKKTMPYARILGFNAKGKEILSNIAFANPKLKLVVSVKKFMEINTDSHLRKMMEKDILATNIYTLGYKDEPLANLDFTHNIVEI